MVHAFPLELLKSPRRPCCRHSGRPRSCLARGSLTVAKYDDLSNYDLLGRVDAAEHISGGGVRSHAPKRRAHYISSGQRPILQLRKALLQGQVEFDRYLLEAAFRWMKFVLPPFF
jgi:hypothetical protein